MTAAKLSRVFAKPFVAALEGHVDAPSCSAAARGHLCPFVTGGMDGEVRVWDLATRRTVWGAKSAHQGWVKGCVVANDGRSFFTAGMDKTVKQWSLGVQGVGGRKEKKKKRERRDKMEGDSEDSCESESSESEEEEEQEATTTTTSAATLSMQVRNPPTSLASLASNSVRCSTASPPRRPRPRP